MRLDLTRIQIEAVAAMLHDELADDERAWLSTLEGETNLYEWVRILLGRIEDDEGVITALAAQMDDRKLRKDRAGKRIDANRQALMALLDCARLDKLALPEATISVRDVPPKPIVNDEAAIPEAFLRIKKSPDMAAIKTEMEAARAVPGVLLDNGSRSITVRRK